MILNVVIGQAVDPHQVRPVSGLLIHALRDAEMLLEVLRLGTVDVELFLHGDRHDELCEAPLDGFESDQAAELGDKLLRDEETKPHALLIDALVLLVHLAEQLEHVRLALLRDADPRVEKLKLDGIDHGQVLAFAVDAQLGSFRADLDVAFQGELGRVSQDIDEDLLESPVVALYLNRTVL